MVVEIDNATNISEDEERVALFRLGNGRTRTGAGRGRAGGAAACAGESNEQPVSFAGERR